MIVYRYSKTLVFHITNPSLLGIRVPSWLMLVYRRFEQTYINGKLVNQWFSILWDEVGKRLKPVVWCWRIGSHSWGDSLVSPPWLNCANRSQDGMLPYGFMHPCKNRDTPAHQLPMHHDEWFMCTVLTLTPRRTREKAIATGTQISPPHQDFPKKLKRACADFVWVRQG